MFRPSTRHAIDVTDGGTVAAVTADVYAGADPGAPVVVLAHGAGSRVDHPVHIGVCDAVAAAGPTVVAFNFAYTEAGRRSPDRTERLLRCYRDVADWVAQAFSSRPIVGGGRSMGGRMASLLAAEGYPFAGLVLLNYPLVSSRGGPGSAPRTDHWPRLTQPVLFVHGTRDRLFPPAVYERSRALLTVPVTTHVIDEADHSFGILRRTGRTPADVYREVGRVVADWLAAVGAAA